MCAREWACGGQCHFPPYFLEAETGSLTEPGAQWLVHRPRGPFVSVLPDGNYRGKLCGFLHQRWGKHVAGEPSSEALIK